MAGKGGYMTRTILALGLVLCLGVGTPAQERAETIYAGPAEGGPRHWAVSGTSSGLNQRAAPSTGSAVILTYPPGEILRNLGCDVDQTSAWCDVQALGGGPRGYVAARFLSPAAAPDGSVVTGENDAPSRAGARRFDATGRLPCSSGADEPPQACKFGVARAGGGDATVVVTVAPGRTRTIHFERGTAVGADAAGGEGGLPFAYRKRGGVHHVAVGAERFEISDAVIAGE